MARSRPRYRIKPALAGTAYVETPDGIFLGRVDGVGDIWYAAPPNPEPKGAMLDQDLPGTFPTRAAAADALLRHHEGEP